MDYLLPLSYYDAPRVVLRALRPLDLLPAKGALLGANWDRAFATQSLWQDKEALQNETRTDTENLAAWRALWMGNFSYDHLPALYRRATVIIDDANHVTEPWGSVNTRVFDGLASGAFVVSNGGLGLLGVFDPPPGVSDTPASPPGRVRGRGEEGRLLYKNK